MKKIYLVGITIIWIMLSCSSVKEVAHLQSIQTQEQSVTPFLFEYRFSETPPNPGNGADKKQKFLKVEMKGEFTAHETFPMRSHIGYSYSKSGMLNHSQLIQINLIIEKLDLPSIRYSEVYLGGGGIEYGWGGYLTYMKAGKTYKLKFSSQHSQRQNLDSELKARILTFIREMDDFFLAEINN